MSTEKVLSPGVFINEIDKSYIPSAPIAVGAAIIGPTVKGPAMVPINVSSYGEFVQIFGDTFKSGSGYYQFLTSHTAEHYLKHSGKLTVIRTLAGSYTGATARVPINGSTVGAAYQNITSASFTLNTISDGAIMNSSSSLKTDNLLDSGSAHNIQWEISNRNNSKGTFSLLIRKGDDRNNRKQILESWSNLTLDPNSNNYISKIIGDQDATIGGSGTTDVYLTYTGSYANSSKYVWVSGVKTTIDYLDENGNVRLASLSASLPNVGSGSFAGGTNGYCGTTVAPGGFTFTASSNNFYENINSTNTQGFDMGTGDNGKTSYEDAIYMLANSDEYNINLLMIPGLIDGEANHNAVVTKAIEMVEGRGDCFLLVDPVIHNSSITTVTTEAATRNSSYTAMYWPWLKIADNALGKNVNVPASVVIPGVFAFNDKIAHPWFVPGGLNRGGLDVVGIERKLRQSNRDDLYDANVNPIASFPGQGISVWGQKTLQKKASALDRINVRRLLIFVKKFITNVSRTIEFEPNSIATRNRFLNIVNPFLEQIKANEGLNEFRVIMDDTNNPPELQDRNILYGQVVLNPTRSIEFILLDFSVEPTGANFDS